MTQKHPLALVAGAGPGLGKALLRRFENGGCKAVGYTRSGVPEEAQGQDFSAEIRALDLSDLEQVQQSVQALCTAYGAPKIVVHNPAHLVIQPLAQTTLADFEASWRNMVLSAFVLAQATMQAMVRGGGGTFIVSGATASLRGGANFSAFASAKFALRGLTQSLARQYQNAGIHVVHAILDGIVDTEESRGLHDMDPARMMKPEEIAEVYWQIAHQPKSTWTQELDLRPNSESF